MKYNRGNIDETIKAAMHKAGKTDRTLFVSATGLGFTIESSPPIGIGQNYYMVGPCGRVEKRNTWIHKELNGG